MPNADVPKGLGGGGVDGAISKAGGKKLLDARDQSEELTSLEWTANMLLTQMDVFSNLNSNLWYDLFLEQPANRSQATQVRRLLSIIGTSIDFENKFSMTMTRKCKCFFEQTWFGCTDSFDLVPVEWAPRQRPSGQEWEVPWPATSWMPWTRFWMTGVSQFLRNLQGTIELGKTSRNPGDPHTDIAALQQKK